MGFWPEIEGFKADSTKIELERGMDKCSYSIIGVSIIWATVVLASGVVLESAEFSRLMPILLGGAMGSILVMVGTCWKMKKE